MQTKAQKADLKGRLSESMQELTQLGDLMGIRFAQNWASSYRVDNSEIERTLHESGLEATPENKFNAQKLLQTRAFVGDMQGIYSHFIERRGEDNEGAAHLFVEQDYADFTKPALKKRIRKKERFVGLGSMVSEYRKAAAFYGVMAGLFAASIFPIGIEKAREYRPEASVDYQLKRQYLDSLETKSKEDNKVKTEEKKLSQPLIGMRRGHFIFLGYPTVFYSKVNEESEAKYKRPIPETFDEARFITNFMLFNPEEHEISGVDKNINWEEFQGYLGFPVNEDSKRKEEAYKVISKATGLFDN
jgi:hypothetical protein